MEIRRKGDLGADGGCSPEPDNAICEAAEAGLGQHGAAPGCGMQDDGAANQA